MVELPHDLEVVLRAKRTDQDAVLEERPHLLRLGHRRQGGRANQLYETVQLAPIHLKRAHLPPDGVSWGLRLLSHDASARSEQDDGSDNDHGPIHEASSSVDRSRRSQSGWGGSTRVSPKRRTESFNCLRRPEDGRVALRQVALPRSALDQARLATTIAPFVKRARTRLSSCRSKASTVSRLTMWERWIRTNDSVLSRAARYSTETFTTYVRSAVCSAT